MAKTTKKARRADVPEHAARSAHDALFNQLKDASDLSFEDMLPKPPSRADQREAQAAQYAHAKAMVAAVGPYALNWMRENFVDGIRFDPQSTDAAVAAMQGFYREGQAALYRHLQWCRKRVEQGPPAEDDEE